ncbi:UDP-glucosyltransferase 2-like [Microplitis mediator]|uniref:UDP-glucosyltransferase 2-like n=1 Tax=Microplitis mediator TaxID=375433 RepID=UPI002552171D|nr:UDP-glucosyltransferase 2-like [Microplitis mediator]
MFSLKVIFIAIVATVFYAEPADALRILGIFPLAGRSHFIPAAQLLKGLAAKGHKVDVVSHFPQSKPLPNYTDISLKGTLRIATNNMTYNDTRQFNSFSMYQFTYMTGVEVCGLLGQPVFEKLLKTPKGTYDLIILELFAANCYIPFGQHLGAPVVAMVVSKMHDWLYGPFGVPFNTAYTPSLFSSFDQRMTFLQRLQNTAVSSIIVAQINYYMENQKIFVEKYFNRKVASIMDLYDEVSIVLLNSHHSLYDIIPTPPAVIEVGGLHVHDDQQELSPEIKKWLDESKDGCVYFTFGSMVRIETYPAATLEIFYEMFKKIAPVRVLLKITDPKLLPPGLPKNVMISPWLPQVAILKHKNTKAFITHGGLMGTQESLAYGVPMVGLPIFGDQYTNLQVYEKRKIAVVLKHEDITAESLTKAVTTVLNDPNYRDNIKRLSKLFLDRPMSAMDTAIFWVEYTARNGNILQSPATKLSWWQYYLIDVYGFILLCIAAVLYITKCLIKFLYRLICSRKSSQNKTPVAKSKKNK